MDPTLIVQLVLALVNAGVTIEGEIVAAVKSAQATGDPWAALAAERVQDIDADLRLPVDLAAARLGPQSAS
jgi:hypothetical protein